MICSGDVFGSEKTLELNLFDVPFMERALDGLAMEVNDCAYPLVDKVYASVNPDDVCQNLDAVFIITGTQKRQGMEQKALIAASGKVCNNSIMLSNLIVFWLNFLWQSIGLLAKALTRCNRSTNTKYLVVSPPTCTNAYIFKFFVKANKGTIQAHNINALTRLDQNRAMVSFAKKNKVPLTDVDRVVTWGNRSGTSVPDLSCATINGKTGNFNKHDPEFIADFQKQETRLIDAKILSSPMALAKAAADHMRDWFQGEIKRIYWENIHLLI